VKFNKRSVGKIMRAVIEFDDGMVVEFSQPLTITELQIWLDHYSAANRPLWPEPGSDRVTKGA